LIGFHPEHALFPPGIGCAAALDWLNFLDLFPGGV
jgi:hypothetical protein